MGPDGHMAGCPFMEMTAVCQMSPFEHIAAWQNMFTATANESALATLLLLLFAAIVFVRSLYRSFSPEIRALSFYRPPKFFLFRHSLQEAFSNGVLNSKAY